MCAEHQYYTYEDSEDGSDAVVVCEEIQKAWDDDEEGPPSGEEDGECDYVEYTEYPEYSCCDKSDSE